VAERVFDPRDRAPFAERELIGVRRCGIERESELGAQLGFVFDDLAR
jgi:hypothetical protein